MTEQLQLRIHPGPDPPTLVYLPGLHGDWTLTSSFQAALRGTIHYVELTYPRTLTWSLEDYAHVIESALLSHGIHHGWLLGESFGSQIVWPFLAQPRRFRVDGVILANGFVRHSVPAGVRMAAVTTDLTPMSCVRFWLLLYARYARFRHRQAPETLANIEEFVARRTDLDRRAAAHRLRLIAAADYRPVARRLTLPVYYLAGLADPIVFWCWERYWLRRHCPGYRAGRTVLKADHNVLGTAPRVSAAQILDWMDAPKHP
jgi:pimeloyl-ACP methyl ester carboxylesterase